MSIAQVLQQRSKIIKETLIKQNITLLNAIHKWMWMSIRLW